MTPHESACAALRQCGATPKGTDPYSLALRVVEAAPAPSVTLSEVAAEYGVSLPTVLRWARAHRWVKVGRRKSTGGRPPAEYARAEVLASLGPKE